MKALVCELSQSFLHKRVLSCNGLPEFTP
jgi:hypothetical protein